VTAAEQTPAASSATHDHLRPVAHFATRATWLNDPNGLLYHDGTWHLFFQHNPHGSTWGNMSWGHATSTDLTTWHEQPVAIAATATEHVYSGSAVADHADTAGLARDGVTPLVAVYTSAYVDDHPRAGIQAQSLAYSLDDGATWQRYAHNPVLDIGSTEFRDPKVFWYGGADGHWVMVAVEAVARRVAVYTSPNLIDWTFASHFGPARAVGGVWECPDLFELPVRGTRERHWVLVVSLNPGAVAGGSGTQYFVGAFDGRTFTTDDAGAGRDAGPDRDGDADWLDFGRDYYAAVSFSGPEDRTELSLSTADGRDTVTLTVDGGTRTLRCDRNRAGDVDFHPAFRSVDVAPLPQEEQTDLRIVVDGCVLEVFAAGGRVTLTQLVFPGAALTELAQHRVARS
jgi:sucrose-6-phosphate hydrolase SacC (GH32 family)